MSDTITDRDEQTVEELRDELRDRDLKVSGTKEELIQRLEDHEKGKDDDGSPDEDVGTVEELRDELRDRDLKVSGTKDELIQRLDEDDEGEGDSEGDSEGASSNDGAGNGSSSLTAVVARIGSELAEITGLRVEGVKGLNRTDDDGWEAVVDLVEVERVPPSMDVLAGYAVTAESDGTVIGFERVHRFRRSEAAS